MKRTLEEVSRMAPGAPIEAVGGVLKQVWPQDTKQGKKGPYCIQNCVLDDGRGSVKLTLWDCQPIREDKKGQRVEISAATGARGFTGLKTAPNYKDPNVMDIHVNKDAIVSFTGDLPHDEDAGRLSPSPTPATPYTGSQTPLRPHGATVGMAVKEACTIVSGIGTDPFSPAFDEQVKTIAGKLLKACRELEG